VRLRAKRDKAGGSPKNVAILEKNKNIHFLNLLKIVKNEQIKQRLR
jgi:hypothetical protein